MPFFCTHGYVLITMRYCIILCDDLFPMSREGKTDDLFNRPVVQMHRAQINEINRIYIYQCLQFDLSVRSYWLSNVTFHQEQITPLKHAMKTSYGSCLWKINWFYE